jgi:hypothetical protein
MGSLRSLDDKGSAGKGADERLVLLQCVDGCNEMLR